jgi:protein-tyrosine phosphatase
VNRETDAAESRRWVELEGASNFRDLGGYVTANGGRVRWGSVFRSDALHQLSEEDLRRLEALGVVRVIDLRSPEEVAANGRGSLGDSDVEYISAPIIPSTSGESQGAPPGDDIAERYAWYLEVGRAAFVEVFETLAASDRGAVVFHCAAGKDRTGVVAALLLTALGVGDDDVASDYALTTQVLPSVLERMSRDPIHGAAVAQAPPGRLVAAPETMYRFLRLVAERHHDARSWMEGAGVAGASIDSLRNRLRTSA